MKIGDKVKVLVWNPDNDPDINPFPAGTIGIIVNHRSMYDNPYQVKANDESWWYKAENLELIKQDVNRVILIEYKEKYDEFPEKIGIASNSEIAHKHIEELKRRCPYSYAKGNFYLSAFNVISEV